MPDKSRIKEMRHNAAVRSSIQAVETIDLAGIFYLTSSVIFKAVYEQLFKYIMLPAAAIGNVMMAALAWKQASLSKYEGHAVAIAIIETIAALAISTAVIGALFFTATFALAAPIVFASAIGVKALFNTGSAFYFGIKSGLADNKSDKFAFRKKALESGVGAIVGILATAGVIAVMLFAKPALAILGIVGGVFGAGAAVMKGIELANPEIKKPKLRTLPDREDITRPLLSRNARVASALNIRKPENDASIEKPATTQLAQKEQTEERALLGATPSSDEDQVDELSFKKQGM